MTPHRFIFTKIPDIYTETKVDSRLVWTIVALITSVGSLWKIHYKVKLSKFQWHTYMLVFFTKNVLIKANAVRTYVKELIHFIK